MIEYNYINQIKNKLGKAQLVYKAPGRINIIGEHTDYNQGLCMPAAIDRYLYFGITPASETEIYSLDQNNLWTPNQNRDLPDWTSYCKGVLDLLKAKGYSWPYFKLAFGGNLPSGAGLSSSSAISCGLISILNAFGDLGLDKLELTKLAVQAEKASGLDGGMMDQITIIHGKQDCALLIDCATWNFNYLPVKFKDAGWLVINTRVKHKLVDTGYNSRSTACREIQQLATKLFPGISSISQLEDDMLLELNKQLNPTRQAYLRYVQEENLRVMGMEDAIKRLDYRMMGRLLFEGHDGLRRLYKVSIGELDFLVDYAKHSGIAFGARMMGGGFGGSTIHLVQKSALSRYQQGICNAYFNRYGMHPESFEANLVNGTQHVHRVS